MDRQLTVPRRNAPPEAPRRSGRHGATHQPPPAPVASRPGTARTPSAEQPVRRIVTGVLVGALTMLAVAVLDTFGGATVPVLGSFAALPAPTPEPEVVEVPAPPATPGTCLSWTRADAADAAVVACAEPHLFEQAGSVTLVDQTALPDDRKWRQLVTERCVPVVTTYLDGRFDPRGRYRVGALKPSQGRWAGGDRELRCGLQSPSHSGALLPTTGTVAASDQSSVAAVGTCLGIDGRMIGDPVDCAAPHAVETVGIVNLAEKFPDAFPPVADQDAFLQPECSRIAAEYAGGPEVVAAKKLTVYWDNLTVESWAAGTRTVNCNLGALLPDRSGFAPVTGSVRGEVVVGSTPAPPASGTAAPGAPATTAPGAPADPPPGQEPVPTAAVNPIAPVGEQLPQLPLPTRPPG